MSEKALKGLGVEFQAIKGTGPWTLPAEALVQIKHTTGVYRRFEKWIAFVLVNVTGKNGNTIKISSEDLQEGDEVAVTGATFLRLTEADLNSDTVDSCSH
ncbi:MAG: hypothetical protein IT285_13690 [Bdellovibrionales bacterium]|nr:hypothetical protein [Bdellovibrionales bacterium]